VTRSSIAWLDLRRESQVLHVPRVRNHFFVLALLAPYSEDIINVGSVHDASPGYYVIAAASTTSESTAGTSEHEASRTRRRRSGPR
jgi:hypothetical protein